MGQRFEYAADELNGGHTSQQPQFFVPPTSGTALNGKPIYDWDEAAAQLTRLHLQWGTLGTPANVTYAFRATAGTTLPGDATNFSQFTADQITAAETALSLWSDVANITFTRVGSGTSGPDAYSDNASILFGDFNAGLENSTGFSYYPGSTDPADAPGDVWINLQYDDNSLTLGSTGFGAHTLEHEIGHAIGLQHPGDYDSTLGGNPTYDHDAVYWQDSRMFTVMSYFGSGNTGGAPGGFSSGPQMHDIAAAQLLYGANMTTRTDDTTYGFNSTTGLAHYAIGSASETAVFCIWDAGGNDTLDLSGYSSNSEIDLREESFSSAGPGSGTGAIYNISIARGAIIENAIGGAGNDTMFGNDVANALYGHLGDDSITAGAGDDTLWGGDGNDTLIGDAGKDLLDGLNNNDNLQGGDDGDTLYGRAGLDTLDGGAGADTMYGGAGDDVYVVDNAGDLTIESSASGNDTVQSSVTFGLAAFIETLTLTGTDAINGIGNILGNTLNGNDANNILSGVAGFDTLNGNGGADTLNGGNGNDTLNGGDGNDVLDGGNDLDTLNGGVGNDTLFGRTQADTLNGDAGNDTLYGGDGNDVLNGGDDNDLLDGLNNNDTLSGGNGDDTLYGRQNDDNLFGDAGNDTLYGGDGNDVLNGGTENDLLDGSNGTDALNGGAGNDTLYGRLGNDTLDGGAGADTLTGGDGDDVFVFHAAEADNDTLIDFHGNGALSGDTLSFVGYGLAADGATFVQVDATHWQINSADGLTHDTITVSVGTTFDPTDYAFG